jgi:hypothetical protein
MPANWASSKKGASDRAAGAADIAGAQAISFGRVIG